MDFDGYCKLCNIIWPATATIEPSSVLESEGDPLLFAELFSEAFTRKTSISGYVMNKPPLLSHSHLICSACLASIIYHHESMY